VRRSRLNPVLLAELTLSFSAPSRSPSAYENNPYEDKVKYSANTDKEMTVVRIVGADGEEIGMLDWFSVHGTSMNNQNGFISGDNKGYAEYYIERLKNGNSTVTGTGKFIAAFVQANAGDVSPNTRGAFCDNGMACEVAHSTCGGWSQNCQGYGPGTDEFDSCRIIGSNQALAALKLYNTANTPVTGPISHVFQYVDMENVQVAPQYSGLDHNISTCIAGLGDSFAAGTTDGPGEFNFVQGTNQSSTNAYWNWLASHILAGPTAEQIKCHFPKPVLLYLGGLKWPAEWSQGILPIQMLRIGQLFIVGVPGEPTTMSGRKMREQIEKVLADNGVKNATVLVTGLTNAYSHYIATPAEYGSSGCVFKRPFTHGTDAFFF
jgi:neutral ceramidase